MTQNLIVERDDAHSRMMVGFFLLIKAISTTDSKERTEILSDHDALAKGEKTVKELSEKHFQS